MRGVPMTMSWRSSVLLTGLACSWAGCPGRAGGGSPAAPPAGVESTLGPEATAAADERPEAAPEARLATEAVRELDALAAEAGRLAAAVAACPAVVALAGVLAGPADAAMTAEELATTGHFAAETAWDALPGTSVRARFVWLLDARTGRGVAKDLPYHPATSERLYYERAPSDLFVGLEGGADATLLARVAEGAVATDVWRPRPETGDAMTGWVLVGLARVEPTDGPATLLAAVALSLENLSVVARKLGASVILFRPDAAGAPRLVGDGNVELSCEVLPMAVTGAAGAALAADLATAAEAADGRTLVHRGLSLTNAVYDAELAGWTFRDDLPQGRFTMGPLAVVTLRRVAAGSDAAP